MAVKYCIERNFFREGWYEVDASTSHNCQSLINSLFNVMRLSINSLDDLIDML